MKKRKLRSLPNNHNHRSVNRSDALCDRVSVCRPRASGSTISFSLNPSSCARFMNRIQTKQWMQGRTVKMPFIGVERYPFMSSLLIQQDATAFAEFFTQYFRRASAKLLRPREKITSQFSRPDLVQVWTIRLSKTAGLARLLRAKRMR